MKIMSLKVLDTIRATSVGEMPRAFMPSASVTCTPIKPQCQSTDLEDVVGSLAAAHGKLMWDPKQLRHAYAC